MMLDHGCWQFFVRLCHWIHHYGSLGKHTAEGKVTL